MPMLREHVPIPLKRALLPLLGPFDDAWRKRIFRAELRRLSLRPPPSARSLQRLAHGWSNGYVADAQYLMMVAEYAARSGGPILECGSGVSTLVAAAYGSHTCYSLEHIESWARRVRSALGEAGLRAEVVSSPLVDRPSYSWYEVGEDLPRRFDLVVCDGPPGTTRGGRYGLLPELGDRLHGAIVLMDDADRRSEQQVLNRWQAEFGVTVEQYGRHAVLRIPAGVSTP
jgi:predicted O-methyltransferase YrrM